MTLEELNSIAAAIKQTKQRNDTVTLRDILSAHGRSSRTAPAIQIVNYWLSVNKLKTANSVTEWTALDEPLHLRFKYNIKHDHFQLYSLKITDFRNLKDFYIDFENTDQYCTLIGLNGSGKSNVLEAISEIFKCLYNEEKHPFDYVMQYIMNGEFYEIRNGKIDGKGVSPKQLPRNVVASYSGEDNRMWQSYYKPFYLDYCRKITEMSNIAVPKMLAVGRKQWSIAFLTLLYASTTNDAVKSFLDSIIQSSECTISFAFNNDNLKEWKETTGKRFVNSLKEKTTFTVSEFSSLIDTLAYIDTPSTLFNLLYQATAERGNNPISDVDITIEGHGSLNNLSEGEKKMIVVMTIIEILSDERTLCLFDEPDSHVHVSRKMEMLKLIDTTNRYSLLTTHSPMFIDDTKEDNIRFMNNGTVENIDKLSRVKQLSGGSISLIDAAYIIGWKKRVLLVEGVYDKKYIERAIEVLSPSHPDFQKIKDNVTIISIGGTGDTKDKYEELIKGIIGDLDEVVFLFDYDKGGLTGCKKVEEIVSAAPSLESKVISLFYQHEYGDPDDAQYPSDVSDISKEKSFMVEDLFDESDYYSVITHVINSKTHKDFRCIKQKTTEKIKEHIEKQYNDFTKYDRFIPLLKKLIDVFDLNNP